MVRRARTVKLLKVARHCMAFFGGETARAMFDHRHSDSRTKISYRFDEFSDDRCRFNACVQRLRRIDSQPLCQYVLRVFDPEYVASFESTTAVMGLDASTWPTKRDSRAES